MRHTYVKKFFVHSAQMIAFSFNPVLRMSWRSFFQKPRPASHVPYIGTRATNMVSALHPAILQVVVSLRSTVPVDILGIRVRDVTRLDRETLARRPRQENIQPYDVTGWRVRSYTSGFLQISAAD